MTEDNKLRRAIQDFTHEQKIRSGALITSHGHVAVVFSPLSTQQDHGEDKLAIACTFAEWRAIGELIESEAAIPWSGFRNTRLLDFLRGAIKSVPSPEKVAKQEKPPVWTDEDEARHELFRGVRFK